MAEETAADPAVVEETDPIPAEEVQEPVQDALPAEALAEAEQPTGEPQLANQELQGEINDLRTTLGERETEIQTLRNQLASATEAYRGALLVASPEIPGEMVNGVTPEEVDVSLAQARQMVECIRTHIEAQLAEQRVPSGAPIRSSQDNSLLSPQEKIAYGLSHNEHS